MMSEAERREQLLDQEYMDSLGKKIPRLHNFKRKDPTLEGKKMLRITKEELTLFFTKGNIMLPDN